MAFPDVFVELPLNSLRIVKKGGVYRTAVKASVRSVRWAVLLHPTFFVFTSLSDIVKKRYSV